MAKSKHKGKGKKKRVGAKTAVGAGLAGGVASFLASKAAGEVVEEVVKTGGRKLLGMRSKATADLERDLGFRLLAHLQQHDGAVRLAQLSCDLKAGLLDLLDAVRALRRARLVKFADGRRVVALTPLGRETMELLARPREAAGHDDALDEMDGSDASERPEAPAAPDSANAADPSY